MDPLYTNEQRDRHTHIHTYAHEKTIDASIYIYVNIDMSENVRTPVYMNLSAHLSVYVLSRLAGS